LAIITTNISVVFVKIIEVVVAFVARILVAHLSTIAIIMAFLVVRIAIIVVSVVGRV